MKVKVIQEIELDIPTLAKCFAELDDDHQVKFFVEVAEYAKRWDRHQSGQWWEVGRHLRACQCSTNEARDMVEMIHHAMNYEPQLAEAKAAPVVQPQPEYVDIIP